MPTTELGAQTEALAAFLRALPDRRTPEATLRAALADAGSGEGGLALAAAPPDARTAEALASLAGAAGYVLCRLRQMHQATRRAAELETLYDVATAIGSTLNMRALLTQIVERTGAA